MAQVQVTPFEVRELDLDDFRLALKDLEDNVQGINWQKTHNHTAPYEISGVQYARRVMLVNGYTVTFEDGQYAVNVVGANSNIGDYINLNQVSVRTNNSAGLIMVEGASGAWTSDEKEQIREALGVDGDKTTAVGGQLQDLVFGGEVHVNPGGGTGTDFPLGTVGHPVDNFTDAKTIADANGIKVFRITGSGFMSLTDDFVGYTFLGEKCSVVLSVQITVYSVSSSVFRNLTFRVYKGGVMPSGTFYSWSCVNCNIEAEMLSGHFKDCLFEYETAIQCANMIILENCTFAEPTTITWYKDWDDSTGYAYCYGLNGDLTVAEQTQGFGFPMPPPPPVTYWYFNQGSLTLTDGCRGGTITVGGDCAVTDNSDGSAVIDQTLDGRHGDDSWEGDADWTSAEQDQIRDALGVDGDKTTAVGGQLQNVPASVWLQEFDGVPIHKIMRAMVTGNAKQENNQWIIYDPDEPGIPLITFNTYDENGSPADSGVYLREKV